MLEDAFSILFWGCVAKHGAGSFEIDAEPCVETVSNAIDFPVFRCGCQRDGIDVVGDNLAPFFSGVRAVPVDAEAGADHLAKLVSGRTGPAAIGVPEFLDLRGQRAAAFDVHGQAEFMAGISESGFAEPSPVDDGI